MTAQAPGARPLPRAAALALIAALAAGASPALAAPEAAEIWRDLQDALAAYDYELDVEDEAIGEDSVRLGGLTLTSETAGQTLDERGERVASTDRLVLRVSEAEIVERGDEVLLVLPDELPVAIETLTEGADPVVITGRILNEGLRIAVSEVAGGLRYALTADAQSFVLDDVEGGEGGELELVIRAEDLASETLTGTADGARTGAQSQRAARLTAEVRFQDDAPGGAGAFDLAYAMADVVVTGETRTPGEATMGDVAAFARAGGLLDGEITYGATRLEAAVDGPGGALDVTGTGEGGTLSTRLGADGIAVSIESAGQRVSLRGPQLPVPELSYSVERSASDVLVPLLAGPEPRPFAFSATLDGLALDDAIWALFDPGAVLPRDPASLDLSVTGTAMVPQDLTGPPEGDADAEPEAPSLATIEVERLALDVAGARLNASGAFAAAEDGEAAVPGLPALDGTLAVDLTGAEALLDGLVAMGLLPQEQAAFARGMLGFVARPTGVDAYATEIELGADGSVTAGGMALR